MNWPELHWNLVGPGRGADDSALRQTEDFHLCILALVWHLQDIPKCCAEREQQLESELS